MARLWLAGLIAAMAPFPAPAQQAGAALRAAGVCARCHVNAVLEWELSGHARAGNSCSACHGDSKGHVADERNTVRPDRIPRGPAAAALCVSCHRAGCPKEQTKDACQTCHHVHALLDPRKPVASQRPAGTATEAFDRAMRTGESAAGVDDWRSAAAAFREAAELRPDARALRRLTLALRKLSPDLPGFRPLTAATHAELGLPLEVEVAGEGTRMILVPGGDVDLGDDSVPGLRPAHTVAVEPFYIAVAPEPGVTTWPQAAARANRFNAGVDGGGFRVAREDELTLAVRTGRATLRGAEWCSGLFRPFPYDAGDGREDARPAGSRTLLTARGRKPANPAVKAAYRIVRDIPAPRAKRTP